MVRRHVGEAIGQIVESPVLPSAIVGPPPRAIADLPGLRCFTGQERRCPIVYFLCWHGEVVYVGQTIEARSRIGNHTQSRKNFDSVFFICVPENELSATEKKFIKELKPKYNVAPRLRPPDSLLRYPVATG